MPAISAESVKVIQILSKTYTHKADMDLGTPEDTILGVLMSARTTDKQVLKVFPGFRRVFPTWKSLANASVSEIAKTINTIGLYKSKAKAIHGLAQKILNEFGGKVPHTMEELVMLPGVGRKTASCVLWYVFGIPAMAVDTHVMRITRRLGWAKGKTPQKVEMELRKVIPEKYWGESNRTMVQFGRAICVPGRPKCWMCPVAKFCAFRPKSTAPRA